MTQFVKPLGIHAYEVHHLIGKFLRYLSVTLVNQSDTLLSCQIFQILTALHYRHKQPSRHYRELP